MRKKLAIGAAMVLAMLVVLAPAAGAKERVLTLHSPKIETLPYVHDTHNVTLKADGRQAPAKPGYVLGFEEMVLVDSKRPDAKPLAGVQDDGAPLPLLRSGTGGPGRGKLLADLRLHLRPGRGAPGGRRAADGEPGVLGSLRDQQPASGRVGARLASHRDGDEPLQAAEELLRPGQGALHHRKAQVDRAGGDRQLRAAAEAHGLRRARRRQEGLQLRRLERLEGALLGPAADGLEPSARRREVPDAEQPHLRAPAVQGAGLPRRAPATSTTPSGRSCTSPGRSARAPTGR